MKLKGYLYAALAAAAYGTNPIFAKPLYAQGMNPDSVLLFRYLLALLGAFEPLTAVVLGVLTLGESVSLTEGLGMILILLAVSMVVKRRG